MDDGTRDGLIDNGTFARKVGWPRLPFSDKVWLGADDESVDESGRRSGVTPEDGISDGGGCASLALVYSDT